MKDQNRIWPLISRKLSGEASEEDLQELHRLIKENPDLGFYLQIVSDMWKHKPPPEDIDLKKDELFQRIRERIKKNTDQQVEPVGLQSSPKRSSIIHPFTRKWGMMVNYFKFTWRFLFRNKAFSSINIGGLSIGMASAIVILLLIKNEFSFDNFHTKRDRIYLVYNSKEIDGKVQAWSVTPMPLGPVMKANYPEAEIVTRVNWVAAFILKSGDKQIQTSGYLADSGFLSMFDFPLVSGNRATALNSSRSIVITENLSRKMFGDEDAMGKIIKVDSTALFTVTGVLKNFPKNSEFRGDYLLPWSYMKEVSWDRSEWNENSIVHTYLLLKQGVTEEAANARFSNIISSHASDMTNKLFLHPMRKWHLWSRFENGKSVGGAIESVRMFAIIGALVLLIACINYMNLSTARSVKRAREVGIRKVVGAGKNLLIGQFLWEAILISLLACIISLFLVSLSIGWFNQLLGANLFIPWSDPRFWLFTFGFVIITGMLAGSYPAFYLSSFKPIRVLKGIFKGSNPLVTPRKVLVVFQFTFAITLIICTIVIYRQLMHGLKRDQGYDSKNLAFVYVKGDALKNYSLIKRDLINSGAITSITRSNSPITDVWRWDHNYEWAGMKPGIKHEIISYNTDMDFVKTVGLTLLSGRDIDIEKYPTDSTAVVLNESAAKLLGVPDAVGQTLRKENQVWHVVGVVRNFISVWAYQPDLPIIIQGPGYGNFYGTFTFRLNGQQSTRTNLAAIGSVFKKHNPDYPFEHYFVADAYAEKFHGEKAAGKLSALFTGLTILISCLGLFALAAYMAENRIREIGIRKVLGASIAGITTLLSKDFLKLVVISFVIASPIAWWVMNAWLSDYSYRVKISWWIFALTGVISILIAATTVSYQAIKAALSNPVKSLRSE